MYHVRTRNWNCNHRILALMQHTPNARRNDSYTDGDRKFSFDTPNPYCAWLVWLYWMLLRPFSGGWTCITRPGKAVDHHYRAIY